MKWRLLPFLSRGEANLELQVPQGCLPCSPAAMCRRLTARQSGPCSPQFLTIIMLLFPEVIPCATAILPRHSMAPYDHPPNHSIVPPSTLRLCHFIDVIFPPRDCENISKCRTRICSDIFLDFVAKRRPAAVVCSQRSLSANRPGALVSKLLLEPPSPQT